ncbi:class I SAM-dependent methyltransferase [Halobacillus seohaensis]|uniref:Class I SAM-dependent methyltransferase n=1 Tax=Halobacillus seohaensis TaxID=447421 RepID=A0ABW2EM94_9BACI
MEGNKFFPLIYDLAMRPLERRNFQNIRKRLIKQAEGRVLELGSGTGVNFPYYSNVYSVDAVEPNIGMVNHAFKNGKHAEVPIRVHDAKAEQLPFNDQTFDSVVATLVFCTISDPVLALNEIERVCKPGAKVILFEHVRTEPNWVACTQDILTPLWKRMCGGCHLNRNTLDLLEKSNLTVEHVDSYYKGIFLTIIARANGLSLSD